jgi:tetratricopeptide (TPR) repeat protein|eukprot:TRINITY_DN43400_c0_g1_i1.p1 TRINITY_DN43400_c0_g1~~TRINITY_DN43400_c0_g1_i1.p1  ORF type:complete len:717 (-),score=143.47 TRINITY_DN43400_c0_g1_i1:248-2398(-)
MRAFQSVAFVVYGFFVDVCSAGAAVPSTTWDHGEVTPIKKTVELLDAMIAQLVKDGEKDGRVFRDFSAWSMNESEHANASISKTKQGIGQLEVELDKNQAEIDRYNQIIPKTAAKIAELDRKLQEGIKRRTQERQTFEAAERTLMESVESLENSIKVLAPSFLENTHENDVDSRINFASVAEKLRTTLLQGGGIGLTKSQRETLGDFVSGATEDLTPEFRGRLGAGSREISFLQVKSQQSGPYEAMSGGVVETLRSILETSQKELDKTRQSEETAAKVFSEFEKTTKDALEKKNKQLGNEKMRLSEHEEEKGVKQSQLAADVKLLKATQEMSAGITAEFQTKIAVFRKNAQTRSDELMALRQAFRILSNDDAQISMNDPYRRGADRKRKSPRRKQERSLPGGGFKFLQFAQSKRNLATRLLRRSSTPGLASLAIKAHTTMRSSLRDDASADPFGKVKNLVRDLLRKLENEQSKEAKHQAWCDKEMADTIKSQKDKKQYVKKTNDKIRSMIAETELLEAELKSIVQEMGDMSAALKGAKKVRFSERSHAQQALKQYQDAQSQIKSAIDALQNFYVKWRSEAKTTGGGYVPDYGAGSGVVGILEIALQDFVDLEEEVTVAETKADTDFKNLMTEFEVKEAVFNKDVEYKNRRKTKLAGDLMRIKADNTGYKSELEAVDAYWATLKTTCIAKGDTYEYRKARREQELDALNEALEFLRG